MSEITINWHIVEECNYRCNYCFAKYKSTDKKELQRSKKDIDLFLERLYSYFNKKYLSHSIRLNIAGGEPTLSKNLSYIIKKAYSIGFKVSLITNASRLTTNFIEDTAKYISMFAISIDSLDAKINTLIGRESKLITLKMSKLIGCIEKARAMNPKINIKINTVVNTYNYHEYMGHFIDFIKPNKWKVFQALSINTDKVFCSDKEYQIFLNHHQKVNIKIYRESNEDMTNSYIMLDPYGRFYQNGNDSNNYNYSETILDISVEEAFSSINFNHSKFNARYENDTVDYKVVS